MWSPVVPLSRLRDHSRHDPGLALATLQGALKIFETVSLCFAYQNRTPLSKSAQAEDLLFPLVAASMCAAYAEVVVAPLTDHIMRRSLSSAIQDVRHNGSAVVGDAFRTSEQALGPRREKDPQSGFMTIVRDYMYLDSEIDAGVLAELLTIKDSKAVSCLLDSRHHQPLSESRCKLKSGKGYSVGSCAVDTMAEAPACSPM